MEDKHRHIDDLSRTSFGKGFTDHAWAEMRQLLDDEMPVVEEKKRRFVWWWAWAAFGLLAGATAFYFLQLDEKQEPKAADMPVATLEKEVEKEESTLRANTTDFNDNAAPQKNENDVALNRTASANFTDNSSRSKTTKTIQSPDIQTVASRENTLPLTTTENSGSTLAILESPQPNQPKTVELEAPNIISEGLKMLSSLDVVPLEKLTSSTVPSLAIETETFKPRKFGMSAYASAFDAPQNSGGGLGAGFLVDFPIKKSRFSIETGVGYAAIFQPVNIVLLAETDVETGISEPGTANSEELVFADGYVTFSNSNNFNFVQKNSLREIARNSDDLLDLHYLQIPFELSYRHGRLRAIAGINAGLLLTSNSDVASGGIFASNKNEADLNADATTTNGSLSSAALDAKVKSFDFAAVGGIGFDISPQIGFDLRYRMGLVDLLEDNYGNKDYNRFLQATLRYRIK